MAGGQIIIHGKTVVSRQNMSTFSSQKEYRKADHLVSGSVQQLSLLVSAADEDLVEGGGGGARGKHAP